MIAKNIITAQQGNHQNMLDLIEQFTPLIKKYTYKLQSEDAYQDMVLEFIVLVKKIRIEKLDNHTDGALVKYIALAMNHAYLRHLRRRTSQRRREISLETLTEKEMCSITYVTEFDEITMVKQLLNENIFTAKEKLILNMIFLEGYTVAADIAEKLGTTRQNINQIKKRALKKLETII